MKTMQIVNFVLIVLLTGFSVWLYCRLSAGGGQSSGKPGGVQREPCAVWEAKNYVCQLGQIAGREAWKARHLGGLAGQRSEWLAAKAQYALHRVKDAKALSDIKNRLFIEDTYLLLLRACRQNDMGASAMSEESGGRLRTYHSPVDGTVQTYSVAVPACYDPAVRWPLVVSMHGHGWYGPFQGHPAPSYGGVISLSPQGRGATDYKDLGEDDVLAAIECVKREFSIDEDRVYLTGASMGGTGAYHLGVHYADQFAGIFPIVGNADNLAWTERWGWNRRFEGRNDALRAFVQEGHTARAFAENLRNLPAYILAGAADTVVPPAHSRNVVAALRRAGIHVEYREYPGVGHGGFPASATQEGLAWICQWSRRRYPERITWKADLLKHGKAYWMRFEQLESPMASGQIEVEALRDNTVRVTAVNLLAFSLQKPGELFDLTRDVTVDINGDQVCLPAGLSGVGEDADWFTFRKHPGTGKWMRDADVEAEPLTKRKGCEGPVHEAFMNPFVLVVGTQNEAMNDVWLHEACQFASDWKYKNAGYPRIVHDTEVTDEMAMDYNLILFGGSEDNAVSSQLIPRTPLRDLHALLHFQEQGKESVALYERPDVGSILVYPNVVSAPQRLAVVIHANSPEGAYQLWGRFGNWFNWGVFDSKKWFDFAIFDARSSSPETMLLAGWFGTDWSIGHGVYFMGNEQVRNASGAQHYPAYAKVAEAPAGELWLYDLKPAKISQMRGALGLGRTFFGEPLEKSIGMRAPAAIEYTLDGRYAVFRSGVRLLNPRECNMCKQRKDGEAIRFTVYGDGKELAKPVVVNWREPEGELEVDVKGVNVLRLEAVPAGGPAWLHAGSAWIEPLLK